MMEARSLHILSRADQQAVGRHRLFALVASATHHPFLFRSPSSRSTSRRASPLHQPLLRPTPLITMHAPTLLLSLLAAFTAVSAVPFAPRRPEGEVEARAESGSGFFGLRRRVLSDHPQEGLAFDVDIKSIGFASLFPSKATRALSTHPEEGLAFEVDTDSIGYKAIFPDETKRALSDHPEEGLAFEVDTGAIGYKAIFPDQTRRKRRTLSNHPEEGLAFEVDTGALGYKAIFPDETD
uniref:Uncharacterized protein n=1 Tax=Mycena chlorophos TaxID=658473 RepID=A0ABQ0M813_MYCCL|nr:predicted protein [Mycena chlorophos]